MGFAAQNGKVLKSGGLFGWLASLLLFLVCCLAVPALAQASEAPIKAFDYRMAGDATKMRIVVDFEREPQPKWFLLRAPNRLVIDLPGTVLALDPKDVKARGLVKNVRYGNVGETTGRLVLTGKGPFLVDSLDVLKNDDGKGYRLAVEISAASAREFEAALADQSLTTGSTAAG